MIRLYHVRLSGPENGKPQRGSAVWMQFVHRDESRARDLGRILSERIARRTGFGIDVTVEDLDLVEESESSLLEAADRLAAAYGDEADGPQPPRSPDIMEDLDPLYDDDARMEEIAADAEDAALHAWGPLSSPRRRANPHPDGTEEARYWDTVFMAAYARENGK
jgi:hypothetical protein